MMKNTKIPEYVEPFLWSSDIAKLDIQKDRKIIIKNVLDFGTKQATDWLRQTYSKEDIQDVIKKTPASAWRRKSLNLWSFIFDVSPERQTRFS